MGKLSNVPAHGSEYARPDDGTLYADGKPVFCPLERLRNPEGPRKIAHPRCHENHEVRMFLDRQTEKRAGNRLTDDDSGACPECCFKKWPSPWAGGKESDCG